MNQLDLFEIAYGSYKIKKPIRLIELFGGIGTQAKALENLNVPFERYKYIDFDSFCVRSYNAIHGTNFKTQDIKEVHAADLEIKEKDKYEYIMTYSFPCQDLSSLGKQQLMNRDSNTRSSLIWEVERILKELAELNALPQIIIIMENVKGIIQQANQDNVIDWFSFLSSLGYQNYSALLNAKDYGIPQSRTRYFCVSLLDTNQVYVFPEKKKLTKTMFHYLDLNDKNVKWLTKSQINYAYNVKKYPGAYFLNNLIAQCITTHEFSRAKITNIIATDLKMYNLMLLPNQARFYNKEWKYSLAYNDLFKYKVRYLTAKESWRLMGFSDKDFEKAKSTGISNTQLYKQAGNSIIVNVLEEIFKQFF